MHNLRTKDENVLSEEAKKGAEIIFSSQTQKQQWPLCLLMPHQFEEVKSSAGRLCLARSRCSRGPHRGAEPPGLKLALPAEQPALHYTPHWGLVREPLGRGAYSSSAAPPPSPWDGEMTLTGSNCQLASQYSRRTGVMEATGRVDMEQARRDGWQGVRCEISGEMSVQQLYWFARRFRSDRLGCPKPFKDKITDVSGTLPSFFSSDWD